MLVSNISNIKNIFPAITPIIMNISINSIMPDPRSLATFVSYFLIAVLVVNLSQRSCHATGMAKRYATLYIGAVLLLIYASLLVLSHYNISSSYVILIFFIAAIIFYLLRHEIKRFKFRCPGCSKKNNISTILYHDDNLCTKCRFVNDTPDSNSVEKPSGIPSAPKNQYTSVDEVDWDKWEFSEEAVLCYIIHENRVFLIQKKTGLGKGKINAPGGRIEQGETYAEAAVREVEEETGLIPKNPYETATLEFVFTNGYSLKGKVFFADQYEGNPRATHEADPFWTDIDNLPYDQMWEDDAHWLPLALTGAYVQGRFIFDEERMIDKEIKTFNRD